MEEHPVPVTDGVVVVARDGDARLLGHRCRACGVVGFPRSDTCPACGAAEPFPVELAATGGAVVGWTTVTAAPPGYAGPVPYGFGIVELDEGVRVLARLTPADGDAWTYGQRVRCVADPVGQDPDGRPVVAWAFAPDGTRGP